MHVIRIIHWVLAGLLCLAGMQAQAQAQRAIDPGAAFPAQRLLTELQALRSNLAQTPPSRITDWDAHVAQSQARWVARWWPRVQLAAAHGDVFALWLRDHCDALAEFESAPDLHASGRRAHCARPHRQAPLQESLASTGFQQADALAQTQALWQDHRRCADQGPRCRLDEAVRELNQRLRVAEQEGVLDGIHVNSVQICPANDEVQHDEAVQACWRLARRLLVLNELAPRAFAMQVLPPASRSEPIYGRLGPVPDEGSAMMAPDAPSRDIRELPSIRASFSDEKRGDLIRFRNQEDAFYTDVWRSLQRIQASVDARLTADARWRLLLRAPRTENGKAPLRTVAAWRKQVKSGSHDDPYYPLRYQGQYLGRLLSNGTSQVLTVLHQSGNGMLTGRYLAVSGEGDTATVELGRINNCLAPSEAELICIWSDRHGFGSLSVRFNADASEFRGVWLDDSPGLGFRRVVAKDWDAAMGWAWTGVRQ